MILKQKTNIKNANAHEPLYTIPNILKKYTMQQKIVAQHNNLSINYNMILLYETAGNFNEILINAG